MLFQRQFHRIILKLLVLCCIFSLTPQTQLTAGANQNPYQDIEDSYAKQEIIAIFQQNIMTGIKPGFFYPKREITRAEFITTLIRLLNLSPVQSPIPSYSDVPQSAWYYGYVQAGTEIGISYGTGAGQFKPNAPLTRQEAAAWISRAFKQTIASAEVPKYVDAAKIARWAYPYINTVTQLQLMIGNDGWFRPADPLTRQETASLLYRILSNKAWADTLKQSAPPTLQIGWQYGQTTEEYKASIMNSNINILSPRWYFLSKDGQLDDYTDKSLLSWAKQNGKQVWALLGNRFDMDATHNLLSSPSASIALINNVATIVQQYDLDGINLDFENVQASDQEGLTWLIRLLSEELHEIGAVLSVDVSPDLKTDWTAAFDYKAIGTYADYVVLMGYDQHWSGSNRAGSVSSLPWIKSGLETLLQEVPAQKAILGLPLYTRDWQLRNGFESTAAVASEDIRLPEQARRMQSYKFSPVWDSDLKQYVAKYTRNGNHQIWLEDSRSLAAKYQMALKHQVAGFAYWHIGGETPEIWTSFTNVEAFENYAFK